MNPMEQSRHSSGSQEYNYRLVREQLKNILGEDYEFIAELGKGQGGAVILCKYGGHDIHIKRLCDQTNFVAVKIPARNFNIKNDCLIAHELKGRYQENEIADLNIGLSIIKNEQYVALILQFVNYIHHLSPPKSASITSFLKEFYQIIVANDASWNSFHDVILKGYVLTLDSICAIDK